MCEGCFFASQGDIVSCAGTYIHVWSINGNPVVSVNTFTGRSQQIVCCCVSEMNEWDTQNVIVTGHSDGVVRVSQLWEYQLSTPEGHLDRLSRGSSSSLGLRPPWATMFSDTGTLVTQPLSSHQVDLLVLLTPSQCDT